MVPASPQPVPAAPRCALCGEPLGVYEPLVEVDGQRVRRTSRAAQPELSHGLGDSYYHVRCFEAAADAAAPTHA